MILVAKVTKMSWFDHPELQGIVTDLLKMCTVSAQHTLIALQAINDLIIEMGYVHRVKNLTMNRRISLNFRDGSLFQIFKQVVQSTNGYAGQLLRGALPLNKQDGVLLEESIYQTLSIYEKCLSFDFTAILLNETLDDPTSTNVPTSWRPIITESTSVQDLFAILRVRVPIKIKSIAC